MSPVDFRNGGWGKVRGAETTQLDRDILADISGTQNDLGLRWVSCHLNYSQLTLGTLSQIWPSQLVPGPMLFTFPHFTHGVKRPGLV